MKKVWINCAPWNKEVAVVALESGADALLVPRGFKEKVQELGLIKTVAEDGDIKLGKEVIQFEIRGKEDEEEAVRLSKSRTLILKMKNWTIIPLENLLAQTEGIFAEVRNAKEARTALQILEKGVEGIFLKTTNLNEIKKTVGLAKRTEEKLKLEAARITRVEPLGLGDRVCIDTCTNMGLGEGMLIGNSSSAFFLIHSESVENPYVEPRPFRVNAGPVHAYTLLPGGRTKYLSELKSGDESLIVNHKGQTQVTVVGRIKVERRPLMLVEGNIKKKKISLILQNAETIRLVSPEGKPISVVALRKGSEVLSFSDEPGRHFGMKIEETITEK
ncbi:3-dehydroquinate synthase II [candidate division NPL-UPA2 bacterium Unc8]|uniref:3-dehydroquinate synthase II n=1 Tax=candidate division NPL-UPA2 bacterium Unc8 TaxID=1980939 RepID=A0A399FXR1_UNCN2|nr:3-amino-4-hydroxybenzoic acid synthase [Bacillota bacterium]MBT9137545.1 3-amino-4-hydroxybenzoic acid synthase [Bacillota bacterium]MBT9147774.1 3-amino-4-hydroxybenzoic acid synthase [Bacillota bacterium]RII00971.1 MAG: 3-dehydroquinate synthase II [candidate division NPL-UPA2 bacterium Unc8]